MNEPSKLIPHVAELELWAAAGDANAQRTLWFLGDEDNYCHDPRCPDQKFVHLREDCGWKQATS